VGLTGSLWRSTNGGTTWAKAGGTAFDNNMANTLHNVSTYANQIWVGSDKGLYISTNGGTNFSLVGNQNSLAYVGMISRFTTGAFAGVGLVARYNNAQNGEGGISRITATDYNNAATYTVTNAAVSGLYFGYPTGLQIFSDGSSSAWNTAGDVHGFSPAGNGGQTYTLRPTTLNTSTVPIFTTAAQMALKNHPDYGTDQVIEAVGDPNKWMITGGSAPMFSMDKGLSWQYFPNGSGIAGVKAYYSSVSRHDINRMYVPASDIGSAIITDGGASGQATISSMKTYNELHGAFRILEGPNTQDLVLAGVAQGTNENLILKTANGGSTWNVLNLSGSGLPLSRDGVTKSVMSLTNANDFIVTLASSTDQQGTVTPGTINPGVWRTTNGGTSFFQVNGLPSNLSTGARYSPQSAFLERDAVQTNVRYFTARSVGLFRSTDGGSNWSATTHPFGLGTWVWDLAADPIRSNNLWVAGDASGVKVSRDGGLIWTSTTQHFDAKYVSSCDGKVAIFGKATGDAHPRLYYSTDDGATFTALTSATNNFHWVQGITVDRTGKVWVSWNSVTVVTPVSVAITGVIVTPATATIVVGATQTLSASVNPSNANQSVTWSSLNPSIATVSSGGVVTGVAAGTATIRATSVADNTKFQSATITVTTPPADLINPSTPTGLAPTSLSSTSFTLNWVAATDNVAVTGYDVFIGGVLFGSTASTSLAITGLNPNTAYSMTVRAKDAAGNISAASTELSVTTNATSGTSTGTGYYWRNMKSATSNSTRTVAPGINDNNLTTDVVVPDNSNANQWQGAGMTWSTAKADITKVEYYSGTQLNNGIDNGCFTAGIQLQYSTNGTGWINASGWSISPAYPYNTTSSNQIYTFTGTAFPSTCRGVRVVGQVKTNDISWAIRVKEVRVYNSSNVLQRTANDIEAINNINSTATVYPNPVTNGWFMIALDAASENKQLTVVLTDISGKRVLTNGFISNGVNQRINITKLTHGVYIMNLINEKSISVKKIVIASSVR